MRRSVSTALRRQVKKEANDICALCNSTTTHDCHIDHVVPLWCGGTNAKSNLQVLCAACHAQKTADEHVMRASAKPDLCIMCGALPSRGDSCSGPGFGALIYKGGGNHIVMKPHKTPPSVVPDGFVVKNGVVQCLACRQSWRMDRCATNTANLVQHQLSAACKRAKATFAASNSLLQMLESKGSNL